MDRERDAECDDQGAQNRRVEPPRERHAGEAAEGARRHHHEDGNP